MFKNKCYLYKGKTRKDGYAKVSVHGTWEYVHRLAFRLYKGHIFKNKLVCHKCNIRNCINPIHLFLGTYKDNYEDSRKSGTNIQGERHPFHKLTEKQVKKIKELLIKGKRPVNIANIYKVKRVTISQIKHRRNWKWVNV